jgi:pre-mRNA-splicing factor ATP-dependent RNA helicase DHX15/PRP43
MLFTSFADQHDKNWCWSNFVSQRAMVQADNVRAQLQRQLEKFEIELVSVSSTNASFYTNIRMALVNGYFMQVAHKAGERGRYKTVKDNQVRGREGRGGPF